MTYYLQEAIEHTECMLMTFDEFEKRQKDKEEKQASLKMQKLASGVSESSAASEKKSSQSGKSPDTAIKSKKRTPDVFVSLAMQKEQQDKRDKLVELLHKDTTKIAESNDFCHYFYQCSTGENLFLHPVSLKLINQEFDQDF